METAIHWATAIAALVGVYLNIRLCVACFYIWAVTNAIWFVVDLQHGIYAQAAVQGVYFCLAIYGIVRWRKMGRTSAAIQFSSAVHEVD